MTENPRNVRELAIQNKSHHDEMFKCLKEIDGKLDSINGRVRKNENDISRFKGIFTTIAAIISLALAALWQFLTRN